MMHAMEARKSLAAALVLLLLWVEAGFAQSKQKTHANPGEKIEVVGWRAATRPFDELAENASVVQISMAAGNERAANLLASIQASTKFLRDRWTHSMQHQPIPKTYVESLQLDADTLGGLVARKLNAADAIAILQDVADDLEIKAAHCKASPKGWASVISVNVNTIKQGNAIAGLEVWYVPKGWADVPDRWMRCAKLSSPAVAEQLPPGNYMVRVASGRPVPVKIGGNGKDEQSVDLLAP